MGFRSKITSIFISALLMAIIWQVTEMGLFRNMTDNFMGKILLCFFAIVIAQFLGAFLSGGK